MPCLILTLESLTLPSSWLSKASSPNQKSHGLFPAHIPAAHWFSLAFEEGGVLALTPQESCEMTTSNKQDIIQFESSLAFNGLCRTNLCLWSTFISTVVRTKCGPRGSKANFLLAQCLGAVFICGFTMGWRFVL